MLGTGRSFPPDLNDGKFRVEGGVMRRALLVVSSVVAILGMAGCGGAGSSTGGGPPSNVPTLSAIAPSSAVVGAPQLAILAYGSNFGDSAAIEWNGTSLVTFCVDDNLTPTTCSSAAALSATVPASDFASAGTAKVTLLNPSAAGTSGGTSNQLNFTITQPTAGNTWVRAVSGIAVNNDLMWDAATGKLYASVASTDPAHPNTIAVIDPVAGSASSFVSAPGNPNLMSISSDGSYMWVGMDGSSSVQRFLLPGLTPDISISLPTGKQAVALQAAPVSAHTVALIAGNWGAEPVGEGVYVYDDTTRRPNSIEGYISGGPMIDWLQWGANDSVIYGDQYTTIDAGGILTLPVNASGVTIGSLGTSLAIQPSFTQYDRTHGLLYSYGGAYNPVGPSLVGSFNLPETGTEACTADSSLGRYYCVAAYFMGITGAAYELWVFDLNTYALLDQVDLGPTTGMSSSPLSGRPQWLTRWGNAGLALTTYAGGTYYGNGGVFLIDGAAVNPNASPDSTSGTANVSYAWLSSMTPDSATTASGDVEVTITGRGFTPESTACWSCNYLQFRFLPTTYVSPTQLNVTIPVASVSSTEPLEISVYDGNSNLFSSNALTFTVLPSSGTTQVIPINLCGLSMAWDSNTQLLYVGTADYDSAHPNSVVAIDPTSGSVVKAQTVEPDPIFLTDSAQGQYLYAAYNEAMNLTQLSLPNLNTMVTAPLQPVNGQTWYPGDLKAAPQDPSTVAATMIMPGFDPEAQGGVAIFDNGTPRPTSLPGWTGGQTVAALYDTLAWGATDQVLASAPSEWDQGHAGPLYQLQVDSSGVSYLGQGAAVFDPAGGYLHSDFGTGLIYNDGGQVGDPHTGAVVGSYDASGLVAPDSSLNRVFILGQTAAQANSTNYTIQAFDEKAFKLVSSITLNNLSGTPIALTRWGNSGLAVLTTGGVTDVSENGLGMLYIVQDAAFVSNANATSSIQKAKVERVQRRWKQMNIRDILARVHKALYGVLSEPRKSIVRTHVN